METNTLDSELINENKEVMANDFASGGKRFLNSLIDTIMLYVLFFIFLLVLGASGSGFAIEGPIRFAIYPIMFAYYVLMEGTTGKTIGKYITKTKVITEDGEKPTMTTALLRSLCRFIPFDAFSFLGAAGRGWHDRFAASRVVNDK